MCMRWFALLQQVIRSVMWNILALTKTHRLSVLRFACTFSFIKISSLNLWSRSDCCSDYEAMRVHALNTRSDSNLLSCSPSRHDIEKQYDLFQQIPVFLTSVDPKVYSNFHQGLYIKNALWSVLSRVWESALKLQLAKI